MIKIHRLNMEDYRNTFLKHSPILVHSDCSTLYRVKPNEFTAGGILKHYNGCNLPADFMAFLLEMWPQILEGLSQFDDFDELLKVTDLFYVNDVFCGQLSEELSPQYVNFEEYVRKTVGTDLSSLVTMFKSFNQLMEKAIAHDTVLADITTGGNLKYHPQTNQFKVLDLEGVQYQKKFPYSVSDVLGIQDNSDFTALYLQKNRDNTCYLTRNFNRAIVLIYFIKLATDFVCLPISYPGFVPMSVGCEVLLHSMGLMEDSILAPYIRKMFAGKVDSAISDETWDAFAKTYTLQPTYYGVGIPGYKFQKK